MSARDIDPIVWAAAYAAAFVHLYAEEHGATDVQPGFMSRRTVALDRIHAPAAVEIADAALLVLRRDGQREQGEETAKARDAAWARLVKAERERCREVAWDGDGGGSGDPAARAEVAAADQALRDIGVDVDALLKEAP